VKGEESDPRDICAVCGSDCTEDWRYGSGCERICPDCDTEDEIAGMEFDSYANELVDGEVKSA
jgi:hypothetical protein